MAAQRSTLSILGASAPSGVRNRLAHDLGVSIVSGKLQPGDSLMSEERFATETGVSRGVYREAIRILAGKGLVHSRVKSATRVNDRASWNMLDVDVLGWMFEAKPSEDFVRDVFELRVIVEPAAAALAALRRSSAEVRVMRDSLEGMESHGLLTEEGRAADREFHRAILQASRNEPLIALTSTISAAIEWTTRLARLDLGQKRDPMPDHRAVFDAIVQRDGKAARAAMATLVAHALSDAGIQPEAFFTD